MLGKLLAEEGVWVSGRAVFAVFFQMAAMIGFLTWTASFVIYMTKDREPCSISSCAGSPCLEGCRDLFEDQLVEYCVATYCACRECGPPPPVTKTA